MEPPGRPGDSRSSSVNLYVRLLPRIGGLEVLGGLAIACYRTCGILSLRDPQSDQLAHVTQAINIQPFIVDTNLVLSS